MSHFGYRTPSAPPMDSELIRLRWMPSLSHGYDDYFGGHAGFLRQSKA
jgi:hypothetical protein